MSYKLLKFQYCISYSVTTQIHRYQILFSLGSLFWASPQDFKTCLLGEGFHTLIHDVLFSSATNVGHHNLPPSGPSVLVGTLSFLRSMWDHPQIYPSSGSSVLTGTPPCVYPLRGVVRKLTHRPVFDFDIICNDQDPLLADIVLFGLSLKTPKGEAQI